MNHLGPVISAFLDGELTPAEVAEADAHLLTCEECRVELAATKNVRDALRQLPSLEWTPVLGIRRDNRPALALALAGVAAIALVGVVAWPPTRSATPPVNRLVAARTIAAFTPNPVVTVPAAAVGAPFHAPASMPGGYHRVGQYKQGSDMGVLYSDGTHSMVVLEQPAQLDKDDMPAGGKLVFLGGSWVGVSYAWSGGRAVTWQRGGTVFTVAGDGSEADVMAAAGAMPAPRSMSMGQRVRRACRGVVEAFSGLW